MVNFWRNIVGGVKIGAMELIELAAHENVSDVELKTRHADSPRCPFTRHYIALERGVEIGFLSADIGSDEHSFVIYEIFVPKRLRRHGIGSRLLKAAEMLARRFHYDSVIARAITGASIYSADGKPFAQYVRDRRTQNPLTPAMQHQIATV